MKNWRAIFFHPSEGIRHGRLFDLLTFLGTLVLSTLLWKPVFDVAGPIDGTFQPGTTLSILFGVAAFLQTLGAFLKAASLQSRIFIEDAGFLPRLRIFRSWKLLLALVAHLALFFFLLILAINGPDAREIFSPDRLPRLLGWILLLCTALPTLATAGSLVLPVPETWRWARLPASEWIGNLCLVFGAVVIQAWFQENVLYLLTLDHLRDDGPFRLDSHGVASAVGSLIPLVPLFLFLYLPPRLLFLVEEKKQGSNWKWIAAFAFALWVLPFFRIPPWVHPP